MGRRTILTFIALIALPYPGLAQSALTKDDLARIDPQTVVISDDRYRRGDVRFASVPGEYLIEAEGQSLCGNLARDAVKAPAGSNYKYLLTDRIASAAGVSVATPEANRARLINLWFEKLGQKQVCNALGDMVPFWWRGALGGIDNELLFEELLTRGYVPVNLVSAYDGRTVLDYVADRLDDRTKASGRKNLSLVWIYGALRLAGAKHRKELEASGAIAGAEDTRKNAIALMTQQIQSGQTANLPSLIALLISSEGGSPDLVAAQTWLSRGEVLAHSNRDWKTLGFIGEQIVFNGHGSNVRKSYPGTMSQGLSMLKSAAEGGDPDAIYHYGNALLWGVGMTRNVDLALSYHMRRPTYQLTPLRIAEGHLLKNNQKEAISWLRYVAQTGGGSLPFEGTSVKGWLAARGEDGCGPNAMGKDNCKNR